MRERLGVVRNLLSISILVNVLLAVSAAMAQTSDVPTAPNDPKLPNVLIIGDSISIGYTAAVTRLLAGTASASRWAVAYVRLPSNTAGIWSCCSGS